MELLDKSCGGVAALPKLERKYYEATAGRLLVVEKS
jgi:hypothetical protein